ncbi:hypothetical protein P2318_16240 [Myxococcaceae bacterium GXIMD 01537]
MRIHPLLFALALSAPLTGCQRSEPAKAPEAAAPAPTAPPEAKRSRMKAIIDELGSPDAATRDEATNQLRLYAAEGIGTEDGILALRAAAATYPPASPGAFDTPAELVHALLPAPKPEYIPVIEEQFSHYSDGARAEALDVLTRLPQREAIVAYLSILRAHAGAGRVPKLPVKELQREPRFAEVLFPEIVNYSATPAIAASILELTLTYANEGQIPSDTLKVMSPKLLERWALVQTQVRAAQEARVEVLSREYEPVRFEAEILLDLMGFLPVPEAQAELNKALGFTDLRLQLFAVIALLRRNEPVAPAALQRVSAHPELRRWLYEYLKKANQLERMPARFRTQAALAETDMVHWLLDTKALGVAPSRIELKKVLTLKPGGDVGELDYYVFRYQVAAPHELAASGWLAGVSGPFRRKEGPSLNALGDTFSAYEPFARKTPEQHAQLQESLQRWKQEVSTGPVSLAPAAPGSCLPEVSAHRCTVPIRCKDSTASAPASSQEVP